MVGKVVQFHSAVRKWEVWEQRGSEEDRGNMGDALKRDQQPSNYSRGELWDGALAQLYAGVGE